MATVKINKMKKPVDLLNEFWNKNVSFPYYDLIII